MTNSNLSPIPFYTSLEEQDSRKWYAYGEHYHNVVPNDYLIPFYFSLPDVPSTTPWEIVKVEVYNCKDVLVSDITTAMTSNGARLHYTLDGSIYHYQFEYLAKNTTSFNLSKGSYYLKVALSTNGTNRFYYYSEVFCVKPSNELNFVKIEWKNNNNLDYEGGHIPYEYHDGTLYYKNILYLDSEIGKPSYAFTDEGEERNGFFFPTKQISEKVFNFGFIAPEYICDVMRTIRMSDVVTITDRMGRVYNVEQFEMNVTWLENGYFASVDCSFQTNTIIKKIGKTFV